MSGPAERFADLAASLPATLDALQAEGLQTLARLGLVASIDGQPAWPWTQRLAIETLAIDAGLARQTLGAAAVSSLLALAVVLALALAVFAAFGRYRVRRARAQAGSVGGAGVAGGAGGEGVAGDVTRAGGAGTASGADPVAGADPVPVPSAGSPWGWARGGATVAVAGLALLLVLATPWPAAGLLLRPAVASSFHRPPADLGALDLARGLRLYREHCAACHGLDGRGETPEAARLPVWPPRLSGALLWRRAEGETWWQVREGMRSADGTETMPGFADRLSGRDTWAVLGALRLLASGQTLAEQGQWAWPVAAPDFAIDCEAGPRRRLADWRGRRVMIAVAGPDSDWPREDPRYETVVLATGPGPAGSPVAGGAGCRAVDSAAVGRLLATVAAVPAEKLAGLRILVDRDGWLRARGRPDEGGWRDEDLVCRTTIEDRASAEPAAAAATVTALPVTGSVGDGLDRLIRRIDADPMPTGRLLVLHGAPARQARAPRPDR